MYLIRLLKSWGSILDRKVRISSKTIVIGNRTILVRCRPLNGGVKINRENVG